MVKYNWIEQSLIRMGVRKPKTFKREARKQIKDNTLDYIKKYGRIDWIPVSKIFEDTLEQTSLFNSKEGNFWFASQGIKSKINSATNELLEKEISANSAIIFIYSLLLYLLIFLPL